MGSDLEDRIRRGIDNQIAGFHMLRAIFLNHSRTGPGGICQHTSAGLLPKRLQYFFRESVRIGRQGIFRYDAGNFPVPDGGILAHRSFGQSCVGTGRLFRLRQAGNTVNVAQTSLDHIGNIQFFRCCTSCQGIDIHIPEFLRIRHRADAKRIQND